MTRNITLSRSVRRRAIESGVGSGIKSGEKRQMTMFLSGDGMLRRKTRRRGI